MVTIKIIRLSEAFVMRASTTAAIDAALHEPRKEQPMHREIAYFPRDFIYLFHTLMTFPFFLLEFSVSDNHYKISLPYWLVDMQFTLRNGKQITLIKLLVNLAHSRSFCAFNMHEWQVQCVSTNGASYSCLNLFRCSTLNGDAETVKFRSEWKYK